jgi:transposase InsO family protein
MEFQAKEVFADIAAAQQITRRNDVWSIEIVRIDTLDRPSVLIVLDVFSRLPVVLDLTSATNADITTKLEDAARAWGYPSRIWIDGGFGSQGQKWAFQHGIEIEYRAPYRKSTILRPLLDDLRIFLTGKTFSTRSDLKRNLIEWRQRYKAAAE